VDALEVAARIATEFAAIEGVLGMSAGGSWVRGDARPDSDLDLHLYYASDHPPSLSELRSVAARLDDRHEVGVLSPFGARGAWSNGGGALLVEGLAVDLAYRDLTLVVRTIDDCRRGRWEFVHIPGSGERILGIHSYVYLGEMQQAHPLYDPQQSLFRLQRQAESYPPALKWSIVTRYMREADHLVNAARSAAAAADLLRVSSCLTQTASALVQILFAWNETHCIREKGVLRLVDNLPVRPDHIGAEIEETLSRFDRSPVELSEVVARMEEIVNHVRLATATVLRACYEVAPPTEWSTGETHD
jgi:predicted nucleotidyltransferase